MPDVFDTAAGGVAQDVFDQATAAPQNQIDASLSKVTGIRAPTTEENLRLRGPEEFRQGWEAAHGGFPKQPTVAGNVGQFLGTLVKSVPGQALAGEGLPEVAEAGTNLIKGGVERLAGIPKALEEAKSARLANVQGGMAATQADEEATARIIQEQDAKAADIEASNKAAQTKWEGDVAKSRQLSDQAAALSKTRADVNTRLDQATRDLGQHVVDVHKNVRAGLDARWDDLRKNIGGDSPISLQPLAAGSKAANSAVTDVNRGLYKSIVNDVLGDVNLKDEGLSWRNAQAAYTKLGERMYGGGELPGDVYRALKQFRAGLSDAMEETASAKGLKGEYQSLKADHSAYESAFHDTRSVGARGGSPVAASLRAADPANKAAPLTGNAVERAKEIIGQYANQGGDPSRIDDVLALKNQLAKMPKDINVPAPPDQPVPQGPPKPKEFPAHEVVPYKPVLSDKQIKSRQLAKLGGKAVIAGTVADLLSGNRAGRAIKSKLVSLAKGGAP